MFLMRKLTRGAYLSLPRCGGAAGKLDHQYANSQAFTPAHASTRPQVSRQDFVLPQPAEARPPQPVETTPAHASWPAGFETGLRPSSTSEARPPEPEPPVVELRWSRPSSTEEEGAVSVRMVRLAAVALETSPAAPAPVRQIAAAIDGWINRLGAVWVEGQIAQVTRRPG